MVESPGDGGVSQEVANAIAALGNAQRLEILLALAAADRDGDEAPRTLSFTALHDAVGVESSSQFSYHLDRLVGRFVSETPEGYRLTASGRRIGRAIRSGVYETPSAFEDRALDGVCVFCGDPSLRATVEDERFVVRCDGCDSVLLTDSFPWSQARDRSPAEIVASVGYRVWGRYVQLRGSVCPECSGRVETRVESHDRRGRTLYTHASACRGCLLTLHLPVEVTVAFHPVALRLFWNQGVSLLDVPLWEFLDYVRSDVFDTERVSSDPTELSCTLALDGESHRFTIDESGRASLQTSSGR